jgi:chemotaxis protein CheD
MFTASAGANTIGEQNIRAVERVLGALRIPVIARDCGGEQGRRMTLDTTTGVVTIEIVGAQNLML